MRRFRLSTVMLLVVIVALVLAMVAQNRQAARLKAALDASKGELRGADARLHDMARKYMQMKVLLREMKERSDDGEADDNALDVRFGIVP